jgi:hypothetical protein
MEKMAESVGHVFKSMAVPPPVASGSTTVDSSPQRMTAAIQRAQFLEREWLTEGQFQDLLDLFENNRNGSMMYLALHPDREDDRKAWIRRKLNISSFSYND